MKKIEAMEIAPEKSKLLCEYINQILSDEQKINGEILINSAKIDGENMCTFDISVPNKDFERHLNTEITTQQIDVLTGQILEDLVENFMESETMGITRYYSVNYMMGPAMKGVSAINDKGSNITINFVCRGEQFNEQIKKYNSKLDEYVRGNQESSPKLK